MTAPASLPHPYPSSPTDNVFNKFCGVRQTLHDAVPWQFIRPCLGSFLSKNLTKTLPYRGIHIRAISLFSKLLLTDTFVSSTVRTVYLRLSALTASIGANIPHKFTQPIQLFKFMIPLFERPAGSISLKELNHWSAELSHSLPCSSADP